ncbi:MAG: type II secretion system F family protein [Armatimonadota bacterium]|nr:type II secretion system F family protein [Armatimonadota bacterium]MCX7776889.1 type II secretion system F family protein [Armatimonadota bacterium]MDW8024425.1 type II secretion system F family protein [Armatimonadota bacterium]
MPTFRYVALNQRGIQVRGELVANTREEAFNLIRQMGHYPLEVQIVLDGKPKSGFTFKGRISHQDLTLLSRQLANLLKGGLPLMRCLEALIEHTENKTLSDVLMQVANEVRSGSAFHEALSKYGRFFPPLYIALIKAGETAGRLSLILEWLADYMERQQARLSQIRASLAYPTLLITLGSIAVFLLITFMVPRFQAIYEELGQALPTPTIVLMNISQLASRWWWAFILAIIGLLMLYRQIASTEAGRMLIDRVKLRIPIYSRLAMKMAVVRFARSLATLLRGGVPILEALDIAKDVLGNEVLAAEVSQVKGRVREGERIAEHLRAANLFPPLLIHMVAVGEEIGDLPGTLTTVAETLDVEVDASLKTLVGLLEPAIILVMGAVVAFVIFAMVLPIFQMNLMAGIR